MLVKDSAAGVIQKLESFTSLYATDNQGYATPPTSTGWPRLRTLTGSDIPDVVSAINGYGASASASASLGFRNMSLAQSGTITLTPSTATAPLSNTFATSTTASSSAGWTEAFVGSRTLGILKSVKFAIRLQQTTNMRIWFGLASNGTSSGFRTDTPNLTFVGFRFSTAASDLKYQCVTQTSNVNSTKAAETTASHVDTNPHIFEIQFDGSNAVFLIDGVQVGSQSGNIPATGTALCHCIFIDNIALTNAQKFDFYSVIGADYPAG